MKVIKGIGKFLLYFLLILIACILLVLAGIWGYQKYKHHQLSKELEQLPENETISYRHILEEHMNKKLGDNKLTVEEKLEEGLNPFQLDTSGNGLSDYDAIHKYHTDPTKFSTMDDGISDYVKIEEGLDPNEKIDPSDIEPFSIPDKELEVTLHTHDLNAKYFAVTEAYEEGGLDTLYKPLRDPFRVKNYEGEVELSLPENADKDTTAYYFDFASKEMVKIKKQKRTKDKLRVTIDQDDPIYILDKNIFDQMNDYYYFRLSLFDFSRAILGYDHLVFIMKRGLFTDELFEEEEIEDVDYGIIQISTAEISKVYALFLDGVYALLDIIFKPMDGTDGDIFARAILDYGKIKGTPEYAERYVMPWLYEEEEIETENDDSVKVIDSGFRPKHHAFPFGNFQTTTGDEGVCAGFSRMTEYIYNNAGIEHQIKFKPERWQSIALNWLNDGELAALQYDISDKTDDYPFLSDGELFNYRFTDKDIAYLSEDTFVDADKTIQPGDISEPDQSLIEMLETQWIYSNEQKHMNEPKDPQHISVLDQVEELLADGQIIYGAMSSGGGGHTVSIYKMEYDRYNPDLIRFYVYDSNLPYERMKEFGENEVYMEVYKTERQISAAVDPYEFIEFDYTPMEDYRPSYSYSTEEGYTLMMYHNDDPIDEK